MPEVAVSLKQVLQVLDQLNPVELAAVEQRLAMRQQTAKPLPKAAADLFELPFDEYLALSDEARDAIAFRAYRTLESWIDAELEQRKAEWILVCGGQVIEASATLRDYPSDEKLMQLGEQRGLVPFVFVKAPLIEEAAWSVTGTNDFYPTLKLTMAAPGTDVAQLAAAGLTITADFDTGSPSLLADYNQLLAQMVIRPSPVNQAHYNRHLGQAFAYHFRPVLIGVWSEAGKLATQNFTVTCIRDWRKSPLCLVNPQREALAGRNLLLEFPLCLELDRAAKTTRVTRV